MKAILRSLHTRLYFQAGASWTLDARDAFAYADLEAALDAAYSSSMSDLELNLILFDDPRFTVRVALDDFFVGKSHWCQRNNPLRKDFWFLNPNSHGRRKKRMPRREKCREGR